MTGRGDAVRPPVIRARASLVTGLGAVLGVTIRDEIAALGRVNPVIGGGLRIGVAANTREGGINPLLRFSFFDTTLETIGFSSPKTLDSLLLVGFLEGGRGALLDVLPEVGVLRKPASAEVGLNPLVTKPFAALINRLWTKLQSVPARS